MINKENISSIKKQLIEQIESTFPQDKRNQAISSINSMNEKELGEFLIQNKLIKEEGNESTEETPKIFRMIVEGKIPSIKIGENEDALSVLEINPISEGHTLIIPKFPSYSNKELKESHFKLAEEIKKKIESAFPTKEVKIISSNSFGEEIINLIPIYKGDENLNSKRTNKENKELQTIKEKIDNARIKEEQKKEISEPIKEPKKEINDKNTWLPRRKP